VNERVFNDFADYIYRLTGIALRTGKEDLLRARIQKRMFDLCLDDYEVYLNYVKINSATENVFLIDAITTNVTSFFREPDHFNYLLKLAPKIIKVGINDLVVWSAACSTGEEVYSIAITLEEALQGTRGTYSVIGTDISTQVLGVAAQGMYSSEVINKVDAHYFENFIKKYFYEEGDFWKIHERIHSKVYLSQINLTQYPLTIKSPVDVIFCRNVMIYFDLKTRQDLIFEFEKLLRPGGLLFIGHSESLAGLTTSLKSIRPSIYRKSL
jgi:chemotaxis protein methyltransferase CheR